MPDDNTLRISPQRPRGSPRVEVPRIENAPRTPGPLPATEASPDDQMYALQKPSWPYKLNLQPHHIEAQDAYHERRTTFTLGLLIDQPWGISELDFNTDALEGGLVGLRRFEGIFPDGTPLALTGVAGANALQRSFEAALRDRKTVDVFLGIPRHIPGKPLVDAADGSTGTRRYARCVSERPELESGENRQAIAWLRPNVRILFEGEAVNEYATLKIAQLFKGPNGRVVYTRKIVPAVLRVQASPVLRDTLQQVHQRLVETRAALASQRREGQEATKSDAARVVLLMTLGRFIPRVADLLGPNVHPRSAYSALAEIVGELSAFGTQGTFAIPPFHILQLGPTFSDLASQVHEILGSITASRYRQIPLTRRADGVRLADLHEPALFGQEFLLAIRGPDPSRVRVEIPHLAKLAAMELLGPLLNAAANGIAITADVRPAGLDVPAQTVCFRLTQSGDQWDELVHRGTLAIYLPEDHKNSDVSLYVKESGALE